PAATVCSRLSLHDALPILPFPWLGRVRLQAANGTELARSRIETIRVLFDHVPRFRMELGPEDPRQLWPEPPQDERWEIPHQPVADRKSTRLNSSHVQITYA